ncbi:MAG TPA: hypothetical protein PLP57_09340 [Candidatus Saccharicenans sp.]|jgi:hypothetical protein|nr:hypothetical protein [Candidatus Saccharicenans sp.]HRD02824.1 hypothetical protein [Candidatus Saccharicenans sp.]
MKHKNLWFLGLALMAVLAYTACSSSPEKTLLDKYFHAVSMNDNQTMASMAVEPLAIEAVSHKVISVSPEIVELFALPDLNKKEIDSKKIMDDHVGPVVESKDALDAAKDELDNARTSGARAALKKKVEELQGKYDEEYNAHKELQADYSATKEAAAKEEQIALFSLGVKSMPGIREMTGEVHSKTVRISVKTKSGAERQYDVLLRRYVLKDQTGKPANGRWIIVKFEPVA